MYYIHSFILTFTSKNGVLEPHTAEVDIKTNTDKPSKEQITEIIKLESEKLSDYNFSDIEYITTHSSN